MRCVSITSIQVSVSSRWSPAGLAEEKELEDKVEDKEEKAPPKKWAGQKTKSIKSWILDGFWIFVKSCLAVICSNHGIYHDFFTFRWKHLEKTT